MMLVLGGFLWLYLPRRLFAAELSMQKIAVASISPAQPISPSVCARPQPLRNTAATG